MITFAIDVRVERALEEVFAYVSDPLNLPRWNSAVRAVRPISGPERDVVAKYSIERQLPGGPVENELEIVGGEGPSELVIRTTSGPTRSSTATGSRRMTARRSSGYTERQSSGVSATCSHLSRGGRFGEVSTTTSPP